MCFESILQTSNWGMFLRTQSSNNHKFQKNKRRNTSNTCNCKWSKSLMNFRLRSDYCSSSSKKSKWKLKENKGKRHFSLTWRCKCKANWLNREQTAEEAGTISAETKEMMISQIQLTVNKKGTMLLLRLWKSSKVS